MIARKKAYYAGIPTAPYDLVKELLVALAVVTAAVVIFALVLSSPDEPSLTLQSVSQSDPQGFVQTALGELNGSGGIANYGPPYNNGTANVQYLGPQIGPIGPFFSIQKLIGVHIPVDTAQDYVLGPLMQIAATVPGLSAALSTYNGASATQQSAWTDAYTKALGKATVSGVNLSVPSCACGPVTLMMSTILHLGQRGAMDGLLLTSNRFYRTDYTRPLLFMADDGAVASHAASFNLLGTQWGVMNETGNYPGQAWLWLYTTLYQIWPYNGPWAANADAMAILTVTILTLILMFIPWIPGLNRLPRYLGVYRLIWKDYYRRVRSGAIPWSE
ncbi:MAG TPA: hypothetical protein VKX16_19055 [Chloroflexota bacterium]|nr:hypothetical protein [Chloroflexota bacterium]